MLRTLLLFLFYADIYVIDTQLSINNITELLFSVLNTPASPVSTLL